MRPLLLLAPLLLAGCATGPNAAPSDPLEPFNRGVYRFNEGLDQAVPAFLDLLRGGNTGKMVVRTAEA